MPDEIATLDWNDTFLDLDHLRQSFPGHTVQLKDGCRDMKPRAPFRSVQRRPLADLSQGLAE